MQLPITCEIGWTSASRASRNSLPDRSLVNSLLLRSSASRSTARSGMPPRATFSMLRLISIGARPGFVISVAHGEDQLRALDVMVLADRHDGGAHRRELEHARAPRV